MQITPAQAPEVILDIFRAGLVPMLTSSPGVGKSSIARQIAEEQNLHLIDFRLAQSDPTDMIGFPVIDKDNAKASYVPMNTFPIEGDTPPGSHKGWLLLLDEFNSAPMAVQAAAYKIILDKQVGTHKLHKNVAIMCAGNLDSDKAIVNRLSTAMQSRLIHLTLDVNVKDWIDWANKHEIDHRVISWINFKNDALHKFDPNHTDKTFPCPRTWEFVSKIIKPWDEIKPNKLPILAGSIGKGMAIEFESFCKIFKNLPTIGDMIAAPGNVKIPGEPSILYAISGLIAANIHAINVQSLMQVIVRLPIEFQIICLRGAIKKTPALLQTQSVITWLNTNTLELM